jgi:hypothetical protein
LLFFEWWSGVVLKTPRGEESEKMGREEVDETSPFEESIRRLGCGWGSWVRWLI